MTDPTTPRLPRDGAGASVGDLVSHAVTDMTRLVRYELDLAKLELKADVRRLGLAALLGVIVAFAGCMVLFLLCFALAYTLMDRGFPAGWSFMVVAGACVLLALAAGLIIALAVRRISGLKKTRATVHDDLALLRRDEHGAPAHSETR